MSKQVDLMSSVFIVVLITTKDVLEAQAISQKLLEEKLIACANIVQDIQSHFWWQGKLDRAQEALLVLKTKQKFFTKIAEVTASIHSYDVPEIIALPILEGSPEYLQWIDESICQ